MDESRAGNPERILKDQEEHEWLAGLIAVLDAHEASAINLDRDSVCFERG